MIVATTTTVDPDGTVSTNEDENPHLKMFEAFGISVPTNEDEYFALRKVLRDLLSTHTQHQEAAERFQRTLPAGDPALFFSSALNYYHGAHFYLVASALYLYEENRQKEKAR